MSDLSCAQINYITPRGLNDYTDALHFGVVLVVVVVVVVIIIIIIIIIKKIS